MTPAETIARITRAIDQTEGLRLALPPVLGAAAAPARPRSAAGSALGRLRLAVELRPGSVRLRLVATRLPLPPLLDKVHRSLRQELADTPWHDATITLMVVDIDAVAFD